MINDFQAFMVDFNIASVMQRLDFLIFSLKTPLPNIYVVAATLRHWSIFLKFYGMPF